MSEQKAVHNMYLRRTMNKRDQKMSSSFNKRGIELQGIGIIVRHYV